MQYHGRCENVVAERCDQRRGAVRRRLHADREPGGHGARRRADRRTGGQAAAFTFDLARSIVQTRQGNPAWAGQERDGQPGPIRSNDLFYRRCPV
jgi:hypothetical protein